MTTEGGRVEGGADENGVGFGRKAGPDQRALFSWAPAVARFWRCSVCVRPPVPTPTPGRAEQTEQ